MSSEGLPSNSSPSSNCPLEPYGNFSTIFGKTDVPQWEAILTIGVLSLFILLTIVGNILVILSVFTYKPLRIVQNFFIISLAVADLTVAVLVLPFNVAYAVSGRWIFGISVCKMWLTSDILCCTASILNLCAIALDRFWAITDPINYAQKRTVKRVLNMIAIVWILSLIISVPPLIGWNDWKSPEEFNDEQLCVLTSRQGYVIYSSSGSFFIPLVIMLIVYIEIFRATKRRLRERAKAAKINISKNQNSNKNEDQRDRDRDRDRESVSSETNHNEHPDEKSKSNDKLLKKKSKLKDKDRDKVKDKEKDKEKDANNSNLKPSLVHEDSLTDIGENSSYTRKNSQFNADTKTNNSPATTITMTSSKASPKVVLADATKKPGFVYQFIEEKQRISLSKERRAARTLGIIMGVFVVCWVPFFLMYVIVPFCATCCPSRRLVNFITWLGYINSFLNPIIYTIFNMDFRRAFRKLLGLGALN